MRLIFDFDGTITEKDTIGDLANAGLDFQRTQHGHDLAPQWDQVVKAYIDDCQQYKTSYPVKEDDRRSVAEEVEFLAGLRNVEKASLARVEGSGVFAGLQHAGLFQMGVNAVESRKIVIREGFKDVVELAERRGWGLGIISVNWSRSFIRGVLHQFNIPIITNEISPDANIHGPEFLGQPLTNSAGKLRCLEHEFKRDGEKTLYFGDSTTDLECLLRGGIVLADNYESSLIRTLRRLRFTVSDIASHGTGGRTNFYWARNFREILDSGILTNEQSRLCHLEHTNSDKKESEK